MTSPIDPAQLARVLAVLRAAAASQAKQAIERGADNAIMAAFAESMRLERAAAEIANQSRKGLT